MKKIGMIKRFAFTAAFVLFSVPAVFAEGEPETIQVECGTKLSEIGTAMDYKASENEAKVKDIVWEAPDTKLSYQAKNNPQEVKAKRNGEDITVKIDVIHRIEKDVDVNDAEKYQELVSEGDSDGEMKYHFNWLCPSCSNCIDKNGVSHGSNFEECAIPEMKEVLPLVAGASFSASEYLKSEETAAAVKSIKVKEVKAKKYTTYLSNNKVKYLSVGKGNKIATKIPKKVKKNYSFSNKVKFQITDKVGEVKEYDVTLAVVDITSKVVSKKPKNYQISISWSADKCSGNKIEIDDDDASNQLKDPKTGDKLNTYLQGKVKKTKGNTSFKIYDSSLAGKKLSFILKFGKGDANTYKVVKKL